MKRLAIAIQEVLDMAGVDNLAYLVTDYIKIKAENISDPELLRQLSNLVDDPHSEALIKEQLNKIGQPVQETSLEDLKKTMPYY